MKTGDIGASFSSVIGEAYATVQYSDRPDPFSHPGAAAGLTPQRVRMRTAALFFFFVGFGHVSPRIETRSL